MVTARTTDHDQVRVSAYPPRVARWVFPPEPDFDYVAIMRVLAFEEIRPVRRQHVVSEVVLKGFASLKERRQGWHLARFDKRRCRELHPRGLDACGRIDGSVQYASGSAEALWDSVENDLGSAIRSAEAGTLY
jgi:hypothetical protein